MPTGLLSTASYRYSGSITALKILLMQINGKRSSTVRKGLISVVEYNRQLTSVIYPAEMLHYNNLRYRK